MQVVRVVISAVKSHCETMASIVITNSIRDVTTVLFAVSSSFHTRLCARDVVRKPSHNLMTLYGSWCAFRNTIATCLPTHSTSLSNRGLLETLPCNWEQLLTLDSWFAITRLTYLDATSYCKSRKLITGNCTWFSLTGACPPSFFQKWMNKIPSEKLLKWRFKIICLYLMLYNVMNLSICTIWMTWRFREMPDFPFLKTEDMNFCLTEDVRKIPTIGA